MTEEGGVWAANRGFGGDLGKVVGVAFASFGIKGRGACACNLSLVPDMVLIWF